MRKKITHPVMYFPISAVILIQLFFVRSLNSLEIFLPLSSGESEISKCNFQTVSRVIDGDTFELSDGTKIRLVGVDTPETLDPRKDVQWFGIEASKKLREWIEGKSVCLRQDRDKTQNVDKYGRLLGYVWSESTRTEKSTTGKRAPDFFVNAELIRQGYGFAYTRYPFQYLEDFRRYEREARENNRGLWNGEEQKIWEKEIEKNKAFARTCRRLDSASGKAKTVCAEDAVNHIGKYRTVRFFVKKSYDSGKAVFLNSKNNFEDYDNFTAVVFEPDKNKFPPQPADFYWGKTVDVTGRIKEYKGRAEIILENRSQIRIIK